MEDNRSISVPFNNLDDDAPFDYFSFTDSQMPETPPTDCESIDLDLFKQDLGKKLEFSSKSDLLLPLPFNSMEYDSVSKHDGGPIIGCSERLELQLPCNGGMDPRFHKSAWERLVVVDTYSPFDFGEDLLGDFAWSSSVLDLDEDSYCTPRRSNDSEWDSFYMRANIANAGGKARSSLESVSKPILFPGDVGYMPSSPEKLPYGRYGPLNMEGFARAPYGVDGPHRNSK